MKTLDKHGVPVTSTAVSTKQGLDIYLAGGAALAVTDNNSSLSIDGLPDKTSSGSATTMLNAASVTTGATTALGDCTALDLSNYDGGVLEVLVAAPTGSTGKLDVKLRYSQDGTNYDTNDDADFFQITVTANGNAYRIRLIPDADVMRYAKVLVKNNDAAQTYTVTVKGYGVISKKAIT